MDSSSRLLRTSQYHSDDEYTLDPVLHDASTSTRQRAAMAFAQRQQPSRSHYAQLATQDSEDALSDDLEAPASLLVEQPHEQDEEEQEPPRHVRQRQLPTSSSSPSRHDRMTTYDRTMWRWANVADLDHFFQRVYAYYQGKGIYCILLARFLNLLTLAFVIGFTTFLSSCVDYTAIPHHTTLSEVIVPQCTARLSGTTTLFLIIFILWWIWQAIKFFLDWPALKEMYNFYTHLLEIPDQDMQTISWQTVLERIMAIRETNPNTAESSPIRINEHVVTNRIMRQENYLIALFNKDILNITIPLPFLRHKHIFTRDLEWNLSFCVLSYVFNGRGQIRKRFLREKNRPLLVAGLRRRFIFMGLLNLIFAPFILVYLVIFFFFRYFEEYHKNPSEIGSRTYSPFAKWKFREYNELPHFFRARLSQSYEPANQYINQFPKEKSALLARFVAFISGSFAGVLAILTLFDSEALLNFQLSPNGTVLFYLGLFGTVFAVSRGMIPDEHLVFEPEALLRQVVEHTHYFPDEWHGKLHTDEVRAQFCQMFDYKISLFAQELLSVLFTPLVLWFSLPKCAEQIVDFFREFTVHVDGLGYVCSFAQFDFARHGNVKYGAPVQVDDEHWMSKDGKMEKSFLNFKANYPGWEPTDVEGSVYLQRISEFQSSRKQRQKQRERVAEEEPRRLNRYGVLEGHEPAAEPSNLGDSFARAGHNAWQVEEEDRPQQRQIIGFLNQVYDLNNTPNL